MKLNVTDIAPGTKIESLKEQFPSDQDFHQWLYQNFEEITEQYSPNHIRWGNLYLDIPIIGTREFSEGLTAYLKKAESRNGAITDLKLLLARIKKDLHQNRLKAPYINLNFKRRYKSSTNYDVSRLEFDGFQYIAANDSIYKHEIPKIESTISYLKTFEPTPDPDEIAHQNTQKQPFETIDEDDPGKNLFSGIEWNGTKTDLAELITGLFRSGKIKKDGQPIQKKELQKIFEVIFNTQFSSVETLLQKRLQSDKSINNQMFIDSLERHVTNIYKELAREVRRKNNP